MSVRRTYIDLLEELQLLRLNLRHEEEHALLAVLQQQLLGMLEHGWTALAPQRAQDDAEPLRATGLHYLLPITTRTHDEHTSSPELYVCIHSDEEYIK